MADGSPVNNTKGNWINLDDSIGYVVLTDLADPAAEWLLPDPTKRSLLKRRMTLRSGKSATFAILAFPNQDHQETARTASQAKLAVIGAVWRVEVGDYVVWANLADIPVKLDMPEQVGLIKTLELGPRTVTATRSGRRIF